MYRYRLLVFYTEKVTEARVAQALIILANDDAEAVRLAKADAGQNAAAGHVRTIQAIERLPVTAGVVFRGDPYIPSHWPTALTPGVASPAPAGAHH